MTERLDRALVLALGFTLSATACSFQRIVVNEAVRELDPSFIEVGRTGTEEVIRRLGLPPADIPEEIGVRIASRRHLEYATNEIRCLTIGLRIGLITPFEWCFEDHVYQLGVEFDDEGIVSGLHQSWQGGYWPPFQDEQDREPRRTRDLAEGGS